MKYSGIDLHSNNAVVAVIDDQDRVLYCKRLANDLSSNLIRIVGTLVQQGWSMKRTQRRRELTELLSQR